MLASSAILIPSEAYARGVRDAEFFMAKGEKNDGVLYMDGRG